MKAEKGGDCTIHSQLCQQFHILRNKGVSNTELRALTAKVQLQEKIFFSRTYTVTVSAFSEFKFSLRAYIDLALEMQALMSEHENEEKFENPEK